MKCPKCKKETRTLRVTQSTSAEGADADFLGTIELSCGCRIPRDPGAQAAADERWESRAKRRTDDNLRSVFG